MSAGTNRGQRWAWCDHHPAWLHALWLTVHHLEWISMALYSESKDTFNKTFAWHRTGLAFPACPQLEQPIDTLGQLILQQSYPVHSAMSHNNNISYFVLIFSMGTLKATEMLFIICSQSREATVCSSCADGCVQRDLRKSLIQNCIIERMLPSEQVGMHQCSKGRPRRSLWPYCMRETKSRTILKQLLISHVAPNLWLRHQEELKADCMHSSSPQPILCGASSYDSNTNPSISIPPKM